MTAPDEDPYENLPEDPELAFLKLEAHYRAVCDKRLDAAGQSERSDVIYVDYMAKVLGAINELGLEPNFQSDVPSIEDVDYNTYLNFNKDVEHYCTVLRIRNSRRVQGYSVQFDQAAKQKIHHHLGQLREMFGRLEVEDKKKESLLFKLDDLQRDVDSNRTRFDRLAALSIEAASVTGEALEKSKVLDILDAIARVFWGAQTEKQKQIPAPPKQKRLEPPRDQKKSPPPADDDDIPF
jgi:hypothetical protein